MMMQSSQNAAQLGLPLDYSSIKTGFNMQPENITLKTAYTMHCNTNQRHVKK